MGEERIAHNRIDLTGRKFGRLTVNCVSHKEGKVLYWNCTCECGNISNVRSQSLREGGTKSCGCLQENFYRDMGDRPAGMSLDRIDNSKDYSPSNCRWASRITQGRNRRNNIVININGQRKVLSELSEETGIKYGTLYKRIVIKGMSADKAVCL